jgi:2-phospho-L-lactate transferase/gluconeogenesis factor (CofD/UPF0052 family)
MTAADHLRAIEQHLPRPVDHILINNQPIPKTTQTHYQHQHEFVVFDDLLSDQRVIRKPLITHSNNYLRHHSAKIAAAVMNCLK